MKYIHAEVTASRNMGLDNILTALEKTLTPKKPIPHEKASKDNIQSINKEFCTNFQIFIIPYILVQFAK